MSDGATYSATDAKAYCSSLSGGILATIKTMEEWNLVRSSVGMYCTVAKKRVVKKYVVPFFVSHFSYCSVLPLVNKLGQ